MGVLPAAVASTASASVAVVQLKSSQDKQENLEASVNYIAKAAIEKARMVCFPEFQMAFSPGSQPPVIHDRPELTSIRSGKT